jgi:hypothetical protein
MSAALASRRATQARRGANGNVSGKWRQDRVRSQCHHFGQRVFTFLFEYPGKETEFCTEWQDFHLMGINVELGSRFGKEQGNIAVICGKELFAELA